MNPDRIKAATDEYEKRYSYHQLQAVSIAKQIVHLEKRRNDILKKSIFKTIHTESDGDYHEFRDAVVVELGHRYNVAIKEDENET